MKDYGRSDPRHVLATYAENWHERRRIARLRRQSICFAVIDSHDIREARVRVCRALAGGKGALPW